MPLSSNEKTGLAVAAQALSEAISALIIDPAVNPLQPQLDAAIAARDANAAARDAAIAERDAAIADKATMQGKIDAAKAKIVAAKAADAIEDQAHDDALAALG